MQKVSLQLKADLVLVLITFIWGTTFSITKIGIDHIPPLFYISFRFLIAFSLMMLIFGKRFNKLDRNTIFAGVILGLVLAVGFATQTLGLQYTTASKAAFITGLSVILTPIISIFLLKKYPSRHAWVGAVLAFLGLAVLSIEPGMAKVLSLGDFLVLLCAIAFGFHIVIMGKYAPTYDITLLATIQVGVTAVLTGTFALILEPLPSFAMSNVWLGILYMGVMATALVLLMQTWAQKYTTPTRTAIIFALEPVFAAIFAFFILSETITFKTILGGLMIFGGILLAELKGEIKEAELDA